MKRIKIVITLLVFAFSVFINQMYSFADGVNKYTSVQSNSIYNNDILKDVTAKSAVLYETTTGTVIAERNSNSKVPIGHLAKLMVVLITEEKIKEGKLTLKEEVTTSSNANSQKAPQIWLNVGEKISIDELLKSITIGNANDACIALAEKIGGNEETFKKSMNYRAKQLGMKNTYFDDVCGISEKTVSTPFDLAILSKEILKHNGLTEYFSTWIYKVRNQATELVSTNRLVRTYSGCIGLKSCSSSQSGECLIAAAKRENMVVCCVLLGSRDDDIKFAEAKNVMDYGFTSFEIYEPEIESDILEDVSVNNGEKLKVSVKLNNLNNILIQRGTYKQIHCDFERVDSIIAPAMKNSRIGTVVFKNGDKYILKCDIVLAEHVKKMSFPFAIKSILLNLLYI